MSALTVRLPDEKHRRLKALAKSRGTPLNRLIDEMTTLMLAGVRFGNTLSTARKARIGKGGARAGFAGKGRRLTHDARYKRVGRSFSRRSFST